MLLTSTAGLYFVHRARAGDLAKIKALIERMGHGRELQRHGLLDTPDAREMVTAALERKIEAACTSLNEEITKLLVGRTVPPKNYADVAATYQARARLFAPCSGSHSGAGWLTTAKRQSHVERLMGLPFRDPPGAGGHW